MLLGVSGPGVPRCVTPGYMPAPRRGAKKMGKVQSPYVAIIWTSVVHSVPAMREWVCIKKGIVNGW